jgi:hypothetical protein
MDIERTEQALAIEDDGIVIEIMDERGNPAMYGGTAVTQDDGTVVTEGELPVTITVAGTYSKKYRKAIEWQRQQVLAMRGKKMAGEQSLRMLSELVARCTIRWPLGAFTLGGGPLPFSVENGTTLYTRLPLVQEQVEAGMSDHAGFIAKNSPSSAST